MQFAAIRIEPHGTLLGFPFTVGRPNVLPWCLYAAVWYWAIRFYQFHRQRRPVDMQTYARGIMVQYFRKRALDYIVPSRPHYEPPADLPEGTKYKLTAHDFSPINYQRYYIEAAINPAWLSERPGKIPEIKNLGDQKVRFTRGVLWTARVLAYSKASIHTPAFTEYFLPYIVFVISIAYASYTLITR
jgi:hypothetical protein